MGCVVVKVVLFVLLMQASAFDINSTTGKDFNSVKALEESLLSRKVYSTNLRPVSNQTHPLSVHVSFLLVAIVSVDNVKQELVTNGFLLLFWKDERLSWNPDDYGGFERLILTPKQLWRPRLMIINTLGDRDPFHDDYSHTYLEEDGDVVWVPGGLFHTRCDLNIQKFPFDVQKCQIQLCPMSYTINSLQFIKYNDVNLDFYYRNPGWDLLNANVTIENITVASDEAFSCPTITFELERHPENIVFNVIVPVIFLSVLNNLVFLIPMEPGEKISYAITVLLSLSVFIRMVSTMTPQVSDTVPALTIYLFVLLLSSVLTVAAAIFTVSLHEKDEREEASIGSKSSSLRAIANVPTLKNTDAPLNEDCPPPKEAFVANEPDEPQIPRHKHRTMSNHVNMLFGVVIHVLTFITTVWYFTFTNS